MMLLVIVCLSMIIRSVDSSNESYIDDLSMSSSSFTRPGGSYASHYYYKPIKLVVSISDTYELTSHSSMDTYGLLYETFFIASNPNSASLLASDDDSGGSRQFRIRSRLESGKVYVLVVTTSSDYVTGSFTVNVSGYGRYSLTPYTISTVSHRGCITSSKPAFQRPGTYSSSDYYYETYNITHVTNGTYTIESTSSSTSSSFDPYGCLYERSFSPLNPLMNKLVCDDDSAASRQFLLTQNLISSIEYILVVTSSFTRRTGNYQIEITGPTSVTIINTTPNVIWMSPGIIGIIAAVTFLFIGFILIGIVVCRCQQRQRQRQRQALPYPIPPPPAYNLYITPNNP